MSTIACVTSLTTMSQGCEPGMSMADLNFASIDREKKVMLCNILYLHEAIRFFSSKNFGRASVRCTSALFQRNVNLWNPRKCPLLLWVGCRLRFLEEINCSFPGICFAFDWIDFHLSPSIVQHGYHKGKLRHSPLRSYFLKIGTAVFGLQISCFW